MPDAVVIGAGPNGLVAANRLADAGWSVVVCDAAEVPGGAVRTGELTAPGFRHDLFSAFYPLALASPALAGLDLEHYGLRWRRSPAVLAHPLPDGSCAELSTELELTMASVEAFGSGDGDAWRAMIGEWERVSKPLIDLLFGPFPPLLALGRLAWRLRPLGLERLARHALLPVRRMAEERFSGAGARLLLGGCAMHTDLAPEASGSGFYGWLLACLGQEVGFPVPEGGAGGLTDALVARLAARGGAVSCETTVAEIVVRGGRAVAVRTAGGETIDARRAVIADVPAPALYGGLVHARHLPSAVLADVADFQWDMSTVKVDWALTGPVPWRAAPARRAATVHIADDFDNLTQFAAEVAMEQLPSRPFLVFGQQSVADPSRSPAGTETAWAYTHVPRRLRGDALGEIPEGELRGTAEEWLPAFVERIEARIEALAPGFRSRILARHVFSPQGLGAENLSLVGGAIGGGTSQLHQQLVLRPIPGSGRPETPIAALYLASSSAHPGGGVHGAAGANAARAALLPMGDLRSVVLGRGKGPFARHQPRGSHRQGGPGPSRSENERSTNR